MHELEFLPEDYIRARFQRRLGFIRSWLLLVLGLAMALWSLQMGAWVRDAQAELQAIRGTGSAVDPEVAKVHLLRQEAEHYAGRLTLLKSLSPQITVADVMAALADLLPDGATLEEVVVEHPETAGSDAAKVRAQGVAPNGAAVMNILEALESSPLFGRANVLESKPRESGAVVGRHFVIEVDVVPPARRQGT